jgi:O-acetyl-ADP-ribose deacetylase (regulator of RNase III)
MEVHIDRTRLVLMEGDIAEQDTDAVVTAAHWDLAGGQGTDGSIHGKAGPELLAVCRTIGGCAIGGAVITPGFRLRARHVIHAVGPVHETGDDLEQGLLASAYRESLRLAVAHGLRSISFPSLSTGAFTFPLRLAARVAVDALVGFLEREPHDLREVRVVLYPREQPRAYSIYAQTLRDRRPDIVG